MPFPTREEIQSALLIYLYESGNHDHAALAESAYTALADRFNLSRSERQQTRDEFYGDGNAGSVWHNMIQFARRDLVEEGYISRDSERGVWKLSPKGIGHMKAALAARNKVLKRQ